MSSFSARFRNMLKKTWIIPHNSVIFLKILINCTKFHMIPQDVARFYKISQNLNFCWKLQICFQHARRHISHLIRSSRAGYNKFVTVEVLSFVQIWPLAIISSQFDFVLTIEVNKNFCCFTLYLSLLLQKFSKVSLKILLCPASQVYNLFF